jgi:FdhD protein
MFEATMIAKTNPGCIETSIRRFHGPRSVCVQDELAVEEPLEILLVYGPADARLVKSISVTMRTPGNDAELAVGFLLTEGVIRDANDVDSVVADSLDEPDMAASSNREFKNVVYVKLMPHVSVSIANLQRNFYTTSSCGICGKASLLALRTVCPPRVKNTFMIDPGTLYRLPECLASVQGIFQQTGGLHAAALFDSEGNLDSVREDVGRHNAVDKLIGAAALADRVPMHNRMLLLSGRASFELLQKALMAGIPLVAAVGAPSSLAVQVAREFDIALVGFLRQDRFNIYTGAEHIRPLKAATSLQKISSF